MKRSILSRLLDITVALLATGAIIASLAIPLAQFFREPRTLPPCRSDRAGASMAPCTLETAKGQ